MKISKGLYLIAAVIATVVMSFFCVGCNGDDKKSSASSTESVILYDFEDYISDFAPLDIIGKFGRVNINEDARFVHDGERSAQLKPVTGGVEQLGSALPSTPTLRFPMNLERKGIDERNFSNTEAVSMYLYNDSTENVELSLYLGNTAGETTNVQRFTLYTKQWNSVSYSVNRAIEDYFVELRDVTYMFLKLPSGYTSENAPEIYLDTIILVKTNTGFERHIMQRDENEIASFDKLDQINFLTQYNTTKNDFFDTRWSVNVNPKYAKDGYSLKVDFNGNPAAITSYQYSGFYMSMQLFEGTGFFEMNDNDKFGFDVYNPGNSDFTLLIVFGGKTQSVFRDLGQTTKIKPGWTHLSWTAAQIKKGADNVIGFTGGGGELSSVEKFSISWGLSSLPAGAHTLYFDNFAIKKASNR